VEPVLLVTLRDVLCASLSLDDGLSTIQNIPFRTPEESDLLFDIARAIEEIILRRPGLASAKLTELTVRLSFKSDRTLPELLTLLDARYTSGHRRAECELKPDIEAIPRLIDILGELLQAVDSAIQLNLRPVLPFFADEVLMTVDAIHDRRHPQTDAMVLREVHSLAWSLVEAGFFEGAELLMNRLIDISRDNKMDEFEFEVTFDYACVLTELRMFDQSRDLLNSLEKIARKRKDKLKLAEVTLQLGVNETRDDSISYKLARKIGDKAAELYEGALKAGLVSKGDLGVAHLVIGSSILVNGWREAVNEAVDRLDMGLKIFDSIETLSPEHSLHIFRTLSGLGFAHGLLGDHENMVLAFDYLNRAKSVLEDSGKDFKDAEVELARLENMIGWVCLCTDSDEFWSTGLASFQRALEIREKLFEEGKGTDLEIIGTRMGLGLSQLRMEERSDEASPESLRDILVQYVPLFPTDTRAFVEVAISTYNVVWLNVRHGGSIPPRLLRLLDDIDRMLVDSPVSEDAMFIEGVSLVVPYLSKSWSTLLERSKAMSREGNNLADVANLTAAMSASKMNVDALSLEVAGRIQPAVDDEVIRVDSLLGHYWLGQTYLVQTIRDFYENRDYSQLATGLYRCALSFGEVMEMEVEFGESSEFIKAVAASLSQTLRRFALALENQYAAYINRSLFEKTPPAVDESSYNFLLADDWLGLVKITNAYLEMVERSELVPAQPYLNAVFSNISRGLKMMDETSLVDRRVLAYLGTVMNKRYYMRM
jgi:hypothetical protein